MSGGIKMTNNTAKEEEMTKKEQLFLEYCATPLKFESEHEYIEHTFNAGYEAGRSDLQSSITDLQNRTKGLVEALEIAKIQFLDLVQQAASGRYQIIPEYCLKEYEEIMKNALRGVNHGKSKE
jgi:hypothetical protein